MTAKLLELKSLTKKFGGIFAVYDLSFHVNEGESLGLIGPNGSGKTTTFNLIMSELKQDEGEIFFRGKEISGYPTHERVKIGISRTYQIPRPFNDMTVNKNIRVGVMPDNILSVMNMNSESIRERQIGASVGFKKHHMQAHPSELSMGDLRRLELARTIATDPKLLLLDEVFAGLTAGEIADMSILLKEKKKEGLTYIIVSHDLKSLAPLVDRVVVVSFGQLIAEGSFEEVIADKKVIEAYLGT
ncbi:MAG: ABC transporter ATP-binding protein [Desulfobacterales bacterium]|jgi:ABC-type branched-subunit amino acid transport system ATPase component